MKLGERYRRLTLWNKIGFWGSTASIAGLVLALLSHSSGTVRVRYTPEDLDGIAAGIAQRLCQPTRAGSDLCADIALRDSLEFVLLMIDNSSSMNEHSVREAISNILRELPRDDLVGMAEFSETYVAVVPFGPHSRESILERISSTKFNGRATNLLSATYAATFALKLAARGPKRLVVFTDGRPTDDGQVDKQQLVENFADIQVDVILFGLHPSALNDMGLPANTRIRSWPRPLR
jgi:hypothetical protein